MSFIYSQALVAAFLRGNCSDTEQFVPSSGSHTPKLSLSHDKTMDSSRLSRFGMTCKPLTESHGAELLTWWLAGFRAKTFPLRGKAQESPENDPECGPTWRASLAKFDPATSSWKTVQLSLLGDSVLSSVTWPRSGMTADGQCWELPMLERRINVTGSGFWPTPTCPNGGRSIAHVTDWRSARTAYSASGKKVQVDLAQAVKLWPTPTSTLGTKGGLVTPSKAREGGTLIEALSARTMWPTPTVCGNYNRNGASKTSGDGLATAVRMWPTPTRHNAKEGGFPSEHERNTPTLAAQAGGALNPTWVEWLMGWPIGHTDLQPSGTAKFHLVPQPHGESLEGLEA